MMPPVQQRILIVLGIILGGMAWLGVSGSLLPQGQAMGLSLTTTPTYWGWAVILVLIAGLPSVIVGTLCAATGRFQAGVFVLGSSLGFIALRGGSIEGWMESASMPSDYKWLIVEMFFWQGWIVAGIWIMYRLRQPMAGRLPRLLLRKQNRQVNLKIPPHRLEIRAGLICSLVAVMLGLICLRTTDLGQVFCSLILIFTLGALFGQLIFPDANPLGVLLSPLVVAVIGYSLAIFRFAQTPDALHALYARTAIGTGLWTQFPGLALALPVHYASAGLIGCSLGLSIARNMAATTSDTATSST